MKKVITVILSLLLSLSIILEIGYVSLSNAITENEVKDNFNLDLIELDEFASLINEASDNPRKKYFDRENQEVIRVLKKVRN